MDQANTCWTGVELAFASLLIYEGLVTEAMTLIQQLDARHRRWGIYWDHQEFGGHYFRPMSAWGILSALLGQGLRDGVLTFAPRLTAWPAVLLWITPDGYGHYEMLPDSITVRVLSGCLRARELRFLRASLGKGRWQVRIGGQLVPASEHAPYLTVHLPPGTALPVGATVTVTAT